MSDDGLEQRARDLAATIRLVLASVDATDMTCSTATRYRLEGALAALEALAGDPSSLISDLAPDIK